MRNPFRPKVYGTSFAITNRTLVESYDPQYVVRRTINRLYEQAHAKDEELAGSHGRWRIWRPRGLDWSTFRLFDDMSDITGSRLIGWKARTR